MPHFCSLLVIETSGVAKVGCIVGSDPVRGRGVIPQKVKISIAYADNCVKKLLIRKRQ